MRPMHVHTSSQPVVWERIDCAIFYPVETPVIDKVPRPRRLALQCGRKLGRQAPDGQQGHQHPRGLVLGEDGNDHLDERGDGQLGQEQAGDVQQIGCIGRLRLLDCHSYVRTFEESTLSTALIWSALIRSIGWP